TITLPVFHSSATHVSALCDLTQSSDSAAIHGTGLFGDRSDRAIQRDKQSSSSLERRAWKLVNNSSSPERNVNNRTLLYKFEYC
ncbi:hypothetical protein ACI2SJ_005492, partial [Escherichia coli]